MQEEDWGKFSQASWRTGGTWKDTDVGNGSKRKKRTRLPRVSVQHTYNSPDVTSSHIKDKFQAEIDLADLTMKLRRWNFVRGWRSASSRSLDDESPISPRSRSQDLEDPATRPSRASLFADQAEEDKPARNDHVTLPCHRKPDAPLDGRLIGEYLDRCIAATEAQLAGARRKSEKERAVKEIERLLERVVTQAGLGEREG